MDMHLPDDVIQLFNNVLQKMAANDKKLMVELWTTWSHLGVEKETKVNNIYKLIEIEEDLHQQVIHETSRRLEDMKNQVEKLKQETEDLSKCLSITIEIPDYPEDMMLVNYMKELEERIEEYREQVKQRRNEMNRLYEWQRDLADKLGVSLQELREVPLPSREELDNLEVHLKALQAERNKREERFCLAQIEIREIMDKLQIKPQNKFEQVVVKSLYVDFKVTDQNMDRLAKLRQDLQEKYEQTNNRVLELRERLTKLWECLEEDQIYRDSFLQSHTGCHPHTETALREEIRRCDQIKKQKIQKFIANVRTKIKLMWDNLMLSNEERQEFVFYYQDIYSEDTLNLHEMYLEKITNLYEEQRAMYEMVANRKSLWNKMNELEARASNPGRYHNRGGQLLKEEKERKAIGIQLPKIEEQLKKLATDYEARTGKSFTVDGKPLLQLIDEEWATRKTERHNKLSARKQALTPNTQLLRSMATSPLGKRNRTAAGLASGADRSQAKRLLLPSSAKAHKNTPGNTSVLKRSAVTSVKRRISGRLVARGPAQAKRKLDLDHKPKIAVNGCILKGKRMSNGKRSSRGRQSSSTDDVEKVLNPLSETLLTTYTDFEDRIHEHQVLRSSLMNQNQEMVNNKADKNIMGTPKMRTATHKAPATPSIGKENIIHPHLAATPKNFMCTPNRLTRSAVKLNHDEFATPRTPLSAKKNMQRVNVNVPIKATTPTNFARSKSQLQIRTKDLPPIM